MAKAVIEVKPRILRRGARAMGPGKADLLDQIAASGSISAAAKHLNMSYSRAWQLVDVMNRAFRTPLVTVSKGGPGGGGAAITARGREALALYRRMQDKIRMEADAYAAAFDKLLR